MDNPVGHSSSHSYAGAAMNAKPYSTASEGAYTSNPICYSCPEIKILNSRRKKRPGFAVRDPSEPTPQFVQPSKVYKAARHPGTPPYVNRGTRQRQIQQQASKAEVSKHAARRDKLKPYVLDPPVQAHKFPKSRYCDFYPWKGNHTEDLVTDAQAKNGQYDKLFVGKHNNEQASARASLAPTFKQRMGLRTLSSLYLTILAKRQLYSTVTTLSTFKPPPRVTLPDQKREAWLRDLATPSVPLRRLSRTIPHGLKGPALLDQCAAKSIPTARAVWFVRCVGANELRGLRRKGVGSLAVGGEAKWIREWTGQVIQFVEKIIAACDSTRDGPWLTGIHYSLRLATHLYTEHLLDRTVFLEWYLSFLETCSVDMLPLVMVLATVFWDDLLKLRKFSRRFSEILLKSATIIANHTTSLFMPLVRRLSITVSNILLCHRDSLIGTAGRTQVKDFLKIADSRSTDTELCQQNVNYRNSYFDGLKGIQSPVSGRRGAIDFLDNISLPFDTGMIFKKLVTLLPSSNLVSCVFEWAVTSLRTGQHRLYLGAELLRYASDEGVNIQALIMDFLGCFDLHTKVKKHDVYLLISELIRTEFFSTAVYMRWLIAKGGLATVECLDENSPCYVRLLAEIPIHLAPAPLRNLRSILLNECSFDCRIEEQSTIEVKNMLSQRGINNMPLKHQAHTYTGLTELELERIINLTRTAKSEIALWIRSSLEEQMTRDECRQNWQSGVMDSDSTQLNVTQLILIRQVLEAMSEIAVLADIVKLILVSSNWDVLGFAINTICLNVEVFSSICPLDNLEQRLFLRYRKLQTQQPLNKKFIESFLELLSMTGTGNPIKQDLKYDLTTQDLHYRRLMVSHSPISETMDDIFDNEDMESNEEIDRLWNIGALVDKQNLSRIFETTVSKMETSFEDRDNQSHIISAVRGLAKLRKFDAEVFDELSQRWVFRMQSYSNHVPLFRAFSGLVAGSCLKLETLVDGALGMLSQHYEGAASAYDGGMFIASVLDLIIHEDAFRTSLSAKDFYTLKQKRKLFVTSYVHKILGLFRDMIELCSVSQHEELHHRVIHLLSSCFALELLRGYTTKQLSLLKNQLVEPLLQPNKPLCLSWLQLLVDNLLDDNDSTDNTEVDRHVQVARLLDLANDFSIGFCKLKMQIILSTDKFGNSDASAHPGNTIARSFIRGIASASQDRRKICIDLITVLNKDCAGKIRADVEELFLEWSTFLRTGPLIEQLDLPLVDDHETGESLARAFLSVIEATSFSTSTGGQFMTSLLVERMVKLLQMFSAQDDESTAMFDLSWRNREAFSEFRCWFILFIRVVVLHRAAFNQAKSSMADQARMLAGLCCLLQSDIARHNDANFEFLFGIAGNFCDGLPDDTLFQLKRYMRGKRLPCSSSHLVGSRDTEFFKAVQKGKTTDFVVKPWERLAEPTPSMGENDVCLSLALFKARRF